MIEDEERGDCIVFGQVLGTNIGWDQANDWAVQFYKFVPNDLGKKLLAFDFSTVEGKDICFCVDYETGVVTISDDDAYLFESTLHLCL